MRTAHVHGKVRRPGSRPRRFTCPDKLPELRPAGRCAGWPLSRLAQRCFPRPAQHDCDCGRALIVERGESIRHGHHADIRRIVENYPFQGDIVRGLQVLPDRSCLTVVHARNLGCEIRSRKSEHRPGSEALARGSGSRPYPGRSIEPVVGELACSSIRMPPAGGCRPHRSAEGSADPRFVRVWACAFRVVSAESSSRSLLPGPDGCSGGKLSECTLLTCGTRQCYLWLRWKDYRLTPTRIPPVRGAAKLALWLGPTPTITVPADWEVMILSSSRLLTNACAYQRPSADW